MGVLTPQQGVEVAGFQSTHPRSQPGLRQVFAPHPRAATSQAHHLRDDFAHDFVGSAADRINLANRVRGSRRSTRPTASESSRRIVALRLSPLASATDLRRRISSGAGCRMVICWTLMTSRLYVALSCCQRRDPTVYGMGISGYPSTMTKVLVSIDERLLARLDKEARHQGLSRSAYLARLAARELDARQGPGRAAHVGQAMERLDRLFAGQSTGEDSTHAIRDERDSR